MRWPFMLRGTHERILAKEVREVRSRVEAFEMQEEIFAERVCNQVRAMIELQPGFVQRFNSEFFPPPSDDDDRDDGIGVTNVPALPSGAKSNVVPLSGDEVVRRAEMHRNLHRKSN